MVLGVLTGENCVGAGKCEVAAQKATHILGWSQIPTLDLEMNYRNDVILIFHVRLFKTKR